MHVRKIVWIAAVLLIILAAALAHNPGGVVALYQGGPGEGTPWPSANSSTVVPVCFRPPGTVGYYNDGTPYTVNYPNDEWLTKQAIVRDAINASWGKWTGLIFAGWGTCPSDVSGQIYVDLIKNDINNPADCGGCGDTMPRGYHPEGVKVWMKMEEADERILRSVAIHEFGHALGFHHEMDRPDAVFPPGTTPCARAQYTLGTYLTPYYDDVSIMSYCAPRDRNGLSFGDIQGAESLYGTSAAGTWLKTLPSQPLFLDVQYGVMLPYVSR